MRNKKSYEDLLYLVPVFSRGIILWMDENGLTKSVTENRQTTKR